ncbi:MAG: type II toxin-antitoxin system RelE/ParE family toxin [Hyphomicrobiales bacterium]
MSRRAIKWTKRALRRLDQVGATIAEDNIAAASTVIARMVASVELLAQRPAMGRVGRVNGTRELVIDALPYIIPYRVKETTIEIITIMHTAQKWPKDF